MHLLPSSQYADLLPLLDAAPLNTLFARAVLEGQVKGTVWVDDPTHPRTWYVVHPYGMSLLLGESGNAAFNEWLLGHALNRAGSRTQPEWLQAWPRAWDGALERLFADHLGREGGIERQTRVNFRFDPKRFAQRPKTEVAASVSISRTDRNAFLHMPGSVVPRFFWRDADVFMERSLGFSLFVEGQIAAMAFAACVHGSQWEIGIETVPEFRGRGYAAQVCAAFIDHCIAQGWEPVWACRKENTGSYLLAQSLGFVPTLELPYFRLPV
jgi:RimJ/RimL family protein N-acetyltransferase